jgi:hypothetical protein
MEMPVETDKAHPRRTSSLVALTIAVFTTFSVTTFSFTTISFTTISVTTFSFTGATAAQASPGHGGQQYQPGSTLTKQSQTAINERNYRDVIDLTPPVTSLTPGSGESMTRRAAYHTVD